MKKTLKTILKVCAVLAAVAAVSAGIYLVVKKILKKKAKDDAEIESFVTCSCIENEPIPVEDDRADAAEDESPAE
jgi:predicted permease